MGAAGWFAVAGWGVAAVLGLVLYLTRRTLAEARKARDAAGEALREAVHAREQLGEELRASERLRHEAEARYHEHVTTVRKERDVYREEITHAIQACPDPEFRRRRLGERLRGVLQEVYGTAPGGGDTPIPLHPPPGSDDEPGGGGDPS